MARRYRGPRLIVNMAAMPERVKELRAIETLVHVLQPLGWSQKQKVIAAALVVLGEKQSKIVEALDTAKG